MKQFIDWREHTGSAAEKFFKTTLWQGEYLTIGLNCLEPDQIQPPPRIGTQIKTDFIKGMGKRDSQFIMILDIDRVFSVEELSAVRGAETGKPLAEVA